MRTVWPMHGPVLAGLAGQMDEPTIDCTFCGRAGAYEVARYTLNDQAEWVVESRGVLCEGHANGIRLALDKMTHYQRIIIMRL